jgi:acetyl-CoA carboxylase biotin carboxyl carrier protein
MNDEKARIESLLAIMREYGLEALTLRVEGTTYELVRPEATTLAAPQPGPYAAPQPSPAQSVDEPGPNVKRVTAPLVGVFYRAPSPESAPYVEVGDRVEVGQVVCIVEAMKMMNEITTEHAGIVTRILARNGELVDAGEDLMWIES